MKKPAVLRAADPKSVIRHSAEIRTAFDGLNRENKQLKTTIAALEKRLKKLEGV